MKDILRPFLALQVDDVADNLKKQGYSVELVETTPPDKNEGQGKKRVIAIMELSPQSLKITWSYENYI